MNATANEYDFIVAYRRRSSRRNRFRLERTRRAARRRPRGPSEVRQRREVPDVTRRHHGIEVLREDHGVYATGFSGGARMTSQLACDDAGLFAAVAPVSGLRRPKPCATTRAVPVISFHGSADPIDPSTEWTELLDLFGRNRGQGLVEPRSLPLNRAFGAGERRQVDDVLHVFERSGDRALRDLR